MERVSQWFQVEEQVDIYVKKWFNPHQKPIAILQLAHGMAEHIERYEDFAHFLVEHGIHVVGNDHRGHGKTGEKAGALGFFAEADGFDKVVDDLYFINQSIHREYPDIPVFLMGHSMGSFLVRRYIQKYSDSIKGIILSGTAGSPGIAGKLGKRLAKWEIRRRGAKAPSPVLDKLSFGSFNKGISNHKTSFDWLTRDSKKVENYINDPLCGFVCSSGFFVDLFTGLEKIHDNRLIQTIPKHLPILIFSGKEDPVGGNGKGVLKVIQQYKQNGLTNIHSILFKEGRHEMLNEINQEEVYQEVYHWLRMQLEQ